MSMFCNQCEQTAKGVGCQTVGVCGKDEDINSLQNTLLYGLKGIAAYDYHARDLGYDAVILFLDELILWLASRAADLAFVSSEGAKLSKLVEAQHADRQVPW